MADTYSQPLTSVQQATIYAMLQDDSYRLRDYQRAWNAYYGKYPNSLKIKVGQPDDNIKKNYCRLVVDKGAFFLFGKDIKFSIEDTDKNADYSELPEPADDKTLWLSKLWRINQQQSVLTKLAINGAVCGHAFLKIVPAQPFPRLICLDPSLVTVAYDPEDYCNVLGYKIQFNSVDPKTNAPTVRRQLIYRAPDGASWVIIDQQSARVAKTTLGDQGFSDGNWQTIGETPWPYSWAPITDCQNLPAPNQYYGTPDLTDDILHLNQAINSVLSNRNRVVRLKGHPITWGKGFGSNQLDISPENFILVKSDQGELKHLEMASDMTPSKQLYDDLRIAMAEQSHIPPIANGELTTFGNISGLALKIAYGPIVDRTELKRRLYGYMLEDINSRLIEMQFGDKALSTVIHWPDILPTDDLAQGQSLQVDKTFGVSNDTLMAKRGYDPMLEVKKRSTEIEQEQKQQQEAQPSLAEGTGLPGDMRTPQNQAKRPDSPARRKEDRAKSEGDN